MIEIRGFSSFEYIKTFKRSCPLGRQDPRGEQSIKKKMKIKVVIFDQDLSVRNCIISALGHDDDFEIVGSFGDTENSIGKILATKPDVILLDIEMNGKDTLDTLEILNAEFPDLKILIQTKAEDDRRIFSAIYAGASGYILKSQPGVVLSEVVKDMYIGGAPISPPIARRIISFLREEAPRINVNSTTNYHLTPRETDVLSELVKGLSYKMIAHKLNISYETVRSHMKKIYEKLQVASLTEVVAKAIKDQIV